MRILITIGFILAFSSYANSDSCINLGVSQNYNVFIGGDIDVTLSDTQGRMAAGGNINLHHYTVGDKLSRDELQINPFSLIATRNLRMSTQLPPHYQPLLGVVHGKAVYGTSLENNGVIAAGGISRRNVQSEILNVDIEMAALRRLSQDLAAKAPTSQTFYGIGGRYIDNPSHCADSRCAIRLVGDNFGLNVFNVDINAFNKTSEVFIEVPQNSYVLINVLGKYAMLEKFAFFPQREGRRAAFDNRRVLINYPDAESLHITHIAIEGSILAPLATVNYPSGVFYGSLWAANLGSINPFLSGQFNWESYRSNCSN